MTEVKKDKLSEQIRACGLFFVSFILFVVLPLVYHTFVFQAVLPMYEVNPMSCVTILIIFHIVLVLLLVSYFQVIMTDAGSVPYELDNEWVNELNLASRFGLEAEVSESVATSDNAPLNLEKKMDGRQRYCQKCNKFKPDRSHHCKYCGRCVLKMDHHCPWVNNCIGFANYKYFMLFCTYVTLETFFVAVVLLGNFIGALAAGEPIELSGELVLYVISFLLTSIISVVMIGFTGFHYSLVLRNVSTIEHVEKRDPKKPQESPFDLGPRQNFEQIMGTNPLLWFIPVPCDYPCDGIHFPARPGLTSV